MSFVSRIGCAVVVALAIHVATLASPAFAETRVALVIGNSNYQHAPRLPNPANDATQVAAALRQVGFATVEVERDLGKQDLERTLKQFATSARGADFVVVYFAGHGMEIGGKNYLVPIDARLAADTDVEFEAVPLDLVLHAVNGARKLKIVVLDACRNNPFLNTMARSDGTRAIDRGLARVEPEDGDMLVAFAAKEGSTAKDGNTGNSPFARAFTRELATPGVEVRLLFGRVRDDVKTETNSQQVPAIYGSLGSQEFYFVAPATGGASPLMPAARTVDPRAIEQDIWDSVKNSNDAGQLQSYLNQYPNGLFAATARAKIAFVNRPAIAPAQTVTARPSALQLASHWAGSYFYADGRSSGAFEMQLEPGNGSFSGQTFNEHMPPYINADQHAFITNGQISGRTVSWTKTYDGRNGHSNSTLYTGELSADGTQISGTWRTQGISGTFTIRARN